MTRRQERERARIHDPQALNAKDARMAIHDRHAIALDAHLARAACMPDSLEGAFDRPYQSR